MPKSEGTRPQRLLRPLGVKFPFSAGEQGLPAGEGPNSIFISNIKQILLTNLGERVMRPTFGSRLKSFLFESIPASIVKTSIAEAVREAINRWEPRVVIDSIAVDFEDSTISIRVTFSTSYGASIVGVILK